MILASGSSPVSWGGKDPASGALSLKPLQGRAATRLRPECLTSFGLDRRFGLLTDRLFQAQHGDLFQLPLERFDRKFPVLICDGLSMVTHDGAYDVRRQLISARHGLEPMTPGMTGRYSRIHDAQRPDPAAQNLCATSAPATEAIGLDSGKEGPFRRLLHKPQKFPIDQVWMHRNYALRARRFQRAPSGANRRHKMFLSSGSASSFWSCRPWTPERPSMHRARESSDGRDPGLVRGA